MRVVVLACIGIAASISLFFALYHWDPSRGPLVWLGLVIPSMVVLALSQGRGGRYECPNCGHVIKVGVLTEFISPHTVSRTYVYCPKCDKFGWGKTVTGDEPHAPAPPGSPPVPRA